MPKTKASPKKEEKKVTAKPIEEAEKIIEIAEEDAVLDDELIPGALEEEESEDEVGLDDEEVDPFKDKWEE